MPFIFILLKSHSSTNGAGGKKSSQYSPLVALEMAEFLKLYFCYDYYKHLCYRVLGKGFWAITVLLYKEEASYRPTYC